MGIDTQTMEQTFAQYGRTIYRLALQYTRQPPDAEDVLQEVLLERCRRTEPFQSPEHERRWLLRVTVNCCKKLHGSFWRRHTVALSETLPAQNPEEGELLGLLEGLPPKYRAVLHLYYYEGYATDEIAAILGRRAATVRSQLSRGRALLRDAWKGAEDV